jgi:hypothetical protein
LRACTCILASSLALAGAARAQVPQSEPKAAPSATITPASDRPNDPKLPASGRNQFTAPVMGIQIEGQGIALPPGVVQADEAPLKPPAPREAAPATAK